MQPILMLCLFFIWAGTGAEADAQPKFLFLCAECGTFHAEPLKHVKDARHEFAHVPDNDFEHISCLLACPGNRLHPGRLHSRVKLVADLVNELRCINDSKAMVRLVVHDLALGIEEERVGHVKLEVQI